MFVYRSARKVSNEDQDKVISDQEVLQILGDFFQKLLEESQSDTKNDIDKVYSQMLKRQHGCQQTSQKNLTVMCNHLGYSIKREKSNVPGAGTGVIVNKGKVKQGSVVALYPGELPFIVLN